LFNEVCDLSGDGMKNLNHNVNISDNYADSEKKYRSFFENTGTAIMMIEEDSTLLLVNSEFEKFSGYTKKEVEGRMTLAAFFAEKETAGILGKHRLRRIDERCVPSSYETQFVDKAGRIKPVYVSVSMIPNTRQSLVSLIDLTRLRRAEENFHKQQAYFNQLFEYSPQAIIITDIEGRALNINKGFEDLFGYNLQEMKGKYNRHIIVPSDILEEAEAFNNSIRCGQSIHKESYRKTKDGRLIPVSVLGYPIGVDQKIENIFYIYEDISERKAFEAELYRQAFYDALTDIPNRALFMERLQRSIERRKRRKDYFFAVMLIDLDRFKYVNDSLGHFAGDKLLIEVARRFRQCLREVDTVARLGGDEFAVLLEEIDAKADVIHIARRLQKIAEEPFYIENHHVHISASIGIVVKTKWYSTSENILRDADNAMYRAKEQGKARFKVFNQKMHDKALESLKLENDLRRAIQEDELVLYYQPIFSILTGRIEGFEALVRWKHPVQGLLSPDRFIPIAEETGLIIPLGQWVIHTACCQLRTWRQRLCASHELTVNVNVSPRQFLQKDLVKCIVETLDETGLKAGRLKLELTESTVMENPQSAVNQLNQLRDIGIQLWIDDFGTGYSSLSYLKRFPINGLKIDRSFVSGKEGEKENMEIVRMIIGLARTLNINVVAEGVENLKQLNELKQMSCDSVQGFFFSKPVGHHAATAMVRDMKCRRFMIKKVQLCGNTKPSLVCKTI
jgi:Amt family ammonium transporter